MSGVDSVPIGAAADGGGGGAAAVQPPGANPCVRIGNLKLLVSLFMLFILVTSNVFVAGVLSGFGEKAVRGRAPTAWGVVLQGTFLVLGYVLLACLVEHHVL